MYNKVVVFLVLNYQKVVGGSIKVFLVPIVVEKVEVLYIQYILAMKKYY